MLFTHVLITIYVAVNALVAAKLMYISILGIKSAKFSYLCSFNDADVLCRRASILAGQSCFSIQLSQQL
jgi:hypothetical protein